MTYAEFQERWELEAGKEADACHALGPDELARRVQRGDYGQYFTIWRAVAEKCELAAVQDAMLDLLKSDSDYLLRYHCAEALISLSGGSGAGFEPVELSGREKFDVDRRLREFEDCLKRLKT